MIRLLGGILFRQGGGSTLSSYDLAHFQISVAMRDDNRNERSMENLKPIYFTSFYVIPRATERYFDLIT